MLPPWLARGGALLALCFVVGLVYSLRASKEQPGNLRRTDAPLLTPGRDPASVGAVDACDMAPGYTARLPPSWLATALHTYNPLNDSRVPHHPVFSVLSRARRGSELVRTDPAYVVEETGLVVPFAYDCTMWDGSPYHLAVPSRWLRCAEHKARVSSGMRSFEPGPPIIDEEYLEVVAVYTAVLAAPRDAVFRVAELGARWGTWGARAAAFARVVRPDLNIRMLFYEPGAVSADGLDAVMAANRFSGYELVRGKADLASLKAWMDSVDRVDIFDMDIQGGEVELLPPLMPILLAKAVRVILGVHSAMRHTALSHFPAPAWRVVRYMPFTASPACTMKLRQTVDHFPGGWTDVIAGGCTVHVEDVGRVSEWDGEIVVDNVALADGPARSTAACYL